jgi:uncharacterized protein (TIGR00255 family)
MTRSMTAFTRQQSEHAWGTLVWEIRSVNHRYLEPSFRMPDTLRHLESPLREQLRNLVQRGKVEAQLKFMATGDSHSSIHLDHEAMAQLHKATSTIDQFFPECSPVSALEILRWPGVIIEKQQDTKSIEEQTLALFGAALESLQEQREREGAQLDSLINDRLAQISKIVADIRQDLPRILEAQAERLRTQFNDLKLEVDPTRVEQEIVLLTQKADIHEELDRLDTHVKEVRHNLKQQGQVGRRLDFLMQELNREANTLCSKAVVTSTTLGAVELKVLIEQMREQIQNIE